MSTQQVGLGLWGEHERQHAQLPFVSHNICTFTTPVNASLQQKKGQTGHKVSISRCHHTACIGTGAAALPATLIALHLSVTHTSP